MFAREQVSFAGYECVRLENGALSVWLMRAAGPRVIGLARRGGANLFAELPDATLECPGAGRYRLRGGHRLWAAPEDPARTYLPDDDPPALAEVDGGMRATQPAEPVTGIQKSLTVTLPDDGACVVVDHTLTNAGDAPVELAPWAITQLKPGGTALLPLYAPPADGYGLLPDRHVVLWPYTRLDSPHIAWGERVIRVTANLRAGALKLGFPNRAGWLAYLAGDTLFVKRAAHDPEAAYYDRGSSSECYCNARFLELETLGPRVTLAPGRSVVHRETWTLHPRAHLRELAGEDLV